MNIQSFDFSLNLLRVVLWQYNDAQNLQDLIREKQEFYGVSHQQFWENWIRDVFDLRTANDFGLSVWAAILNIQTYTESEESPNNYPAWGFATSGPSNNFNNSNFATEPGSFGRLNTEQRRLLLRLRYYQLTTDGTIPEINAALLDVFNNQNTYVLDGGDMSIVYVFTTIPSTVFLTVLQEFDILPRPSGVQLTLRITPQVSWGFGEFHSNFDSGNFFGS